MITEGFKITVATVIGFFGLAWAYVLVIWSSFITFVITPALQVLFGERALDLYGIASLMLFLSWVFIIAVAILNILLTASRGQPRIFQNITESKEDNI
ncbi:MAG: hypothetical protein LN408_03230 [Candidatus Thermoplasmatota archaeon]|nr:hypothetical protein [Candidatus Thermoplasmatota archaeon]